MKCRQLLAAAVAAALGVSAAGAMAADDAKQRSGNKASSGATASADAPVIVLVPVQVASRDSFSNGCWARLYDGGNFRGNQLSLVGPVDMPNMRTAFGTDWSGEFDSIEVGPKATLTVYDNENYREKAATIKPGQRIADLDERMGFFQDISSVKIACAGGQSAQQGQQEGSAAAGGSGSAASGAGASTFESLDTDNDGSLSRSEYNRYKQ